MGRLLAALGRIQAWVWASALLSLVLMLLTAVSLPQPAPGAVFLSKATVALAVAVQDAPKSVALPHVWDDEQPPWQGDARYAFEWPREMSPSQPLALFLPRVGARFRVWLNDRLIEEVSWDTPGYVDTSVVPHLVDLPAELIRPAAQDNRLEVEVRGQLLRKSGMSPISIGPREALQARYQRVFWWQVHATWMVVACSVVLALLSGLIWLQSREPVFAFLSAASVAWALRLALSPLVNPPMPFELWFYLHKLSYTVYCGFIYLFLWDLFDHPQGRLRSLGTGILWLGPLWLAVTTLSDNYNLYRVWTGVLAVVAVTALALMFRRARWGLDGKQRLLLVAGLVTVITGVRDFGVVQLGLPGDADLRWMPVGSLVFLLTLASVLVQRTADYVQQVSQLNEALELRVKEKESELHAAFERLRAAERRQVLEDERRRLTRDMHDGLGSQLVQALNVVRASDRAEPAVVSAMLNHALQELRMTLDSLEPLEGDLPAILGMLRRRITPALDAAGIELDWQVKEVPAIAVKGEAMESRGVMHLFRCLQEVFANIIKHSQASRVTVRTWVDGEHAMLGVTDNGRGLGEGFRQGGRGLSHIRLRAAEIGALVLFEDLQPGTRVQFRFATHR
ncbi:MAG: ATP-binding protein [Burkholderiaceae bacterium]